MVSTPTQHLRTLAAFATHLVKLELNLVGCIKMPAVQPIQPPSTHKRSHYERSENKDRIIVFVHGIFGDSENTWTCQPNTYWPGLLRSDEVFKDFDIYVVQYDTPLLGNRMSIDDIVNSLNERFKHDEVLSKHREVIFVAHSLGGLIVQRFLLTYRPSQYRVPFIYFYSTPETGAQIARLGSLFSRDPLLQQMLPGDKNLYLRNLENEWRGAEFSIRRYCAYEKKDTDGALIVDPLSGTRSCDSPAIAINEDHQGIVKPCTTNDDSYIVLQNAIKGLQSETNNRLPDQSPFTSFYENTETSKSLGPPQTFLKRTDLSEQFFEHGYMLWRHDRWKIYVLYYEKQRWNVYEDNATSMVETPKTWTLNPPKNRFEPEGGFKKIWIEEGLGKTLGWAVKKARHGFGGYVQDFEKGVLIGPVSQGPSREYPPSGFIYAFLEKGPSAACEKGKQYERVNYP